MYDNFLFSWFDFMGSTADNPFAPMQINFIFETNSSDAFNPKNIYPCNETYKVIYQLI